VLIQGFNAFVPEGHRIETNILDTNEYTVTVTTPAGTETSGDPQRVKIISATLPTIVKDGNSPSERAKEGMAFANQYMAKLTTRYAGNTNVAKQFLEILQKYNKDVPDSDVSPSSINSVGHVSTDSPRFIENGSIGDEGTPQRRT
jgi:histone deacetylase complex regulatory component SIN3